MEGKQKGKTSKQGSESPTTSVRLSTITKKNIKLLGTTFGEKDRQVIERAVQFLVDNLKQAVSEDNERRLRSLESLDK